MKAQILKIAGVKSEKEFYKKFPTEEAFMKVHGKELEKAQGGVMIPSAAPIGKIMNPRKVEGMQNMMPSGNNVWGNPNVPGALMPAAPIPQFIDPQSVGGMQNMMSWDSASSAKSPSFNVPVTTPAKAQNMSDRDLAAEYAKMTSVPKQPNAGLSNALKKYAGPAGEIVGAIQQIKAEKEMLKGARQMEKVSDVAFQASTTREKKEAPRRRDTTITGEEFFPINGVGTNPLAKNGAEISNTFAPNTLYSDLGYEKAQTGKSAQYSSVVDYMKASGRDSSIKARKELAKSLGFKNYTGKGDDNKSLLQALINEDEINKSFYNTERIVNPETGAVDFEEIQVYQEPVQIQQAKLDAIRKSYEAIQKSTPIKSSKKSADLPAVLPIEVPSAPEDFFTIANRAYSQANPEQPFIDSRPDDRKLNMFEVMQNKMRGGAYGSESAAMALRDNPNNPLKAFLDYGVTSVTEPLLSLGISGGKMLTGKGDKYDALNLAIASIPGISNLTKKLPGFGRLVRMKTTNAFNKTVGNPMLEELTLENLFSGANKFMPSIRKVAAQYKYDMSKLAQAAKTDKKVAKLLQDAAEEEEIIMGIGDKMKPGTTMPWNKFDSRSKTNMNDLYERSNYQDGGNIPEYQKAAGGLEAFANMGGGDTIQGFGNAAFGQSGGSRLGGTIGGTIGSAFGPVGKMVGQVAGDLLGRALDKNQQNTEKAQNATMRNIQSMGFQNSARGLQEGQYTSFMEDGGKVSPYEWVGHTWQPQVIASFGEHKLSDLLRPDETMDTLRAGGHLKEYTPPSINAMSTERPEYAAGGELRTDWGGHLKPLSYNPFSDGDGMTYLGVGNSHEESDGKGRTGIGMTYGESKVEIEHGEPVQEMEDGGAIGEGEKSVLVSGNLMIPHSLLGDESAKGKNFKTYVRDISELENKATQKLQKATSLIGSMKMNSQFDKLKYNSLDATALGATMELKNYDERKKNAAALQTAMNDTMEEFGLKANDKGRITAKDGIEIAQDGKKKYSYKAKDPGYLDYNPLGTESIEEFKNEDSYKKLWLPKVESVFSNKETAKSVIDRLENYQGQDAADVVNLIKKGKTLEEKIKIAKKNASDFKPGPYHDLIRDIITPAVTPSPTPAPTPVTVTPPETPPVTQPNQTIRTTTPTTTAVPLKGPSIMDYLGATLPYLRPSNAKPLDPNQLVGEMYALSNNQLEPVQAQGFQPELGVPYDISFQDRLNENQATFRSMQRMAGYNPAAQAAFAAQKYGADQPILAEQFRANQAFKQSVYDKNRDLINQGRLTNLGIFDKQYERQATARGLTKATTVEALKSMANKYLQNQLENRTLQTYENLYAYRFDPKFRAINMNAPAQWNMQGSGGLGGQGFGGGLDPNYEFTYNAQGRIIGTKKKSKSDDDDVVARNGAIVKNLKSL